LDLLRDEGDLGMKMHSAYYDAFQICVTHGDLAHAVAFAELAAKMRDGEGPSLRKAVGHGMLGWKGQRIRDDFTEHHIS
jgi:hypothetical protein